MQKYTQFIIKSLQHSWWIRIFLCEQQLVRWQLFIQVEIWMQYYRLIGRKKQKKLKGTRPWTGTKCIICKKYVQYVQYFQYVWNAHMHNMHQYGPSHAHLKPPFLTCLIYIKCQNISTMFNMYLMRRIWYCSVYNLLVWYEVITNPHPLLLNMTYMRKNMINMNPP